VAALAYSKIQTPKYQSTALIQESTAAATQTGQSGSSTQVSLPDPVQELSGTAVQEQAAKILDDPDVGAVASEVTGTVDATTGELSITATDASPERAQAVASAYSKAYTTQIAAVVQAQIDKLTNDLASLRDQIGALQSTESASNSVVVGAQIAGLTSSYSTLQTQLNSIQFGMPYATVQVAAQRPGAPSGLGTSKLVAIGLLAGLLVGCGIALARDQFDNRLRTSPEIGSITDSPILAELPQDAEVRSGSVALAMVQAPQSGMAEAIRELRTSLRVILDDTPCPMIVVTSPQAGDGKTFITANLACAWAMSGSKVIVVSADFRRPRLEEIFGLPLRARAGLADLIRANWKTPDPERQQSGIRDTTDRTGVPDRTEPEDRTDPEDRDDLPELPELPELPGLPVLPGIPDLPDLPALSGLPALAADGRSLDSGRRDPSREAREPAPISDPASVASHLVDSGIWGLQILPAGIQLDNPSELFGSPGMQPVIDQLSVLADVVLVDTPPVMAVPDTAIIGSFVRGAVVVASEGKTDRGDLERTIRRLESTHCRVLGVALNQVRRTSADSYQAYAYRP
jgi:Mrp family chromosome partitioning ATPase/capsular polysaccharide biosynthesis protein